MALRGGASILKNKLASARRAYRRLTLVALLPEGSLTLVHSVVWLRAVGHGPVPNAGIAPTTKTIVAGRVAGARQRLIVLQLCDMYPPYLEGEGRRAAVRDLRTSSILITSTARWSSADRQLR